MKTIKWSQWDGNLGMTRCGYNDLRTIMKWMTELGTDANNCLKMQDKPHAVYGRKIYDADDNLEEVRFYSNVFADDDELERIVKDCNTTDVIYAVHKL